MSFVALCWAVRYRYRASLFAQGNTGNPITCIAVLFDLPRVHHVPNVSATLPRFNINHMPPKTPNHTHKINIHIPLPSQLHSTPIKMN